MSTYQCRACCCSPISWITATRSPGLPRRRKHLRWDGHAVGHGPRGLSTRRGGMRTTCVGMQSYISPRPWTSETQRNIPIERFQNGRCLPPSLVHRPLRLRRKSRDLLAIVGVFFFFCSGPLLASSPGALPTSVSPACRARAAAAAPPAAAPRAPRGATGTAAGRPRWSPRGTPRSGWPPGRSSTRPPCRRATAATARPRGRCGARLRGRCCRPSRGTPTTLRVFGGLSCLVGPLSRDARFLIKKKNKKKKREKKVVRRAAAAVVLVGPSLGIVAGVAVVVVAAVDTARCFLPGVLLPFVKAQLERSPKITRDAEKNKINNGRIGKPNTSTTSFQINRFWQVSHHWSAPGSLPGVRGSQTAYVAAAWVGMRTHAHTQKRSHCFARPVTMARVRSHTGPGGGRWSVDWQPNQHHKPALPTHHCRN